MICLVGDVATTHDFGGILASIRMEADITIVILDNGGGGIFSFLPISDAISKEQFDKYFLTSPMLPFADIFKSLRVDVATPQTIKELKAEITKLCQNPAFQLSTTKVILTQPCGPSDL
ncbi:MAG: hypothetical protein CM15mP49_10210 [Actinomycetota bacterium]|nr:MAG: hypothetical protein CM15mP49_10210 [Actinomycetota bacterium]